MSKSRTWSNSLITIIMGTPLCSQLPITIQSSMAQFNIKEPLQFQIDKSWKVYH